MSSQSLEDKVKDGPSVAGGFFASSLIGTILGYLVPLSIPYRIGVSLASATVVSLFDKKPLRTAPLYALGIFAGETLGSYLRYN